MYKVGVILWHMGIHNLNNPQHPAGSRTGKPTGVILSKHTARTLASFSQAIQSVQIMISHLVLTTMNTVKKLLFFKAPAVAKIAHYKNLLSVGIS